MRWWVLVLVGAGVIGVAQMGLRRRRARAPQRAAERLSQGRFARVPVVLVVAGDVGRRGYALGDGQGIRVLTPRRQFTIQREGFDRPAPELDRFAAAPFLDARLHEFADITRDRVLLGPPGPWVPVFDALVATPHPPASRFRLFVAAVSRPWWWAAVIFALATSVVMAVWWTGVETSATVVRHVDFGDDLYSCGVSWMGGGSDGYAEVDCYEPLPEIGSAVRIRALAWPFEGEAMDYEGAYEALTTLTVGPALLALVVALGLGLHRARRRPARLVPLEVEPLAGTDANLRTPAAAPSWHALGGGPYGEPPRASSAGRHTAPARDAPNDDVRRTSEAAAQPRDVEVTRSSMPDDPLAGQPGPAEAVHDEPAAADIPPSSSGARTGSTVPVDPAGGLTRAAAETLPLRELIDRLAEREAWRREPDPAPEWGEFADFIMAAWGRRWWLLVPLLALSLLVRLPQPAETMLAAVAVTLLVRAVYITVSTFSKLRYVYDQPVSGEWDYLFYQHEKGRHAWSALLMSGSTARWLLPVGGPWHPALAGRCTVRGPLRHGTFVHFIIDGAMWKPAEAVELGATDREWLRKNAIDRLFAPPTRRRHRAPVSADDSTVVAGGFDSFGRSDSSGAFDGFDGGGDW